MASQKEQRKDEKPKLDIFRSYISLIENCVQANIFRNEFYVINGKSIDVLDGGDLSCASFVTGVLYLFDLIGARHTTVNASVTDLETNGWRKISTPQKGAVILWGFKKKDDGTQGKHRHLGFYLDEKTAISNSSDERVPMRHHPTYGAFPSGEARRDILAFYWHPTLASIE